jgi:hypothetical protein
VISTDIVADRNYPIAPTEIVAGLAAMEGAFFIVFALVGVWSPSLVS